MSDPFETRKKDHIQLALDPASQAQGLSGLDRIQLLHEALPELNFEEVQIDCAWKDTTLTPFFIAGMTAGHPDAPKINHDLAEVSEKRGWAMGVGSQRRDLEDLSGIDRWKEFRKHFSQLILFSNLGGSQILTTSTKKLIQILEALQPQALAIHLNSLQEALQIEGTPFFQGLEKRLKELTREISIPIILKETGCGFSKNTLLRLRETGLSAIDVSGLGGTHWGRIEGERAQSHDFIRAKASQTFANWGISTVDSVRNATLAFADHPSPPEIWASGGVRNGLDAAKLIALGAHRVGYARPALQAVLKGKDLLNDWMKQQEFELRLALFCTGHRSLSELRGNRETWTINNIS